MKILITGSEGLLGKIISKELKKKHELTLLDKNIGIDILKDKIIPYFKGIDTVIHLAANPNPFIKKHEANKNIEIAKKVIDACEYSKNLKKIINASSINVYPFMELFEKREQLTSRTSLSANTLLGDGSYGEAKIKTEKLFENYCQKNNLSLLNLRIGYVLKNDQSKNELKGSINYAIHLNHKDLIKIINKSLKFNGIKSYVCVSNRKLFVDDDIKFPL